MNISLCKFNKTCLEDWPRILLFTGAEDVVMAFSRSETEDRRQWPLPFPALIPPHCISPCPRPIPYVIHTNLNSTNTTLMSSGEERHLGEGLRRRGRDTRGWLPRSPSSSYTPDTSWHTITWDALKCFTEGWSLGNKEVGENTHRLCGWISNVVSFSFCWVVLFCIILSVLRL